MILDRGGQESRPPLRSALMGEHVVLNGFERLKIRGHHVAVRNLEVASAFQQSDEVHQCETVEHPGLEKVIAVNRRCHAGALGALS